MFSTVVTNRQTSLLLSKHQKQHGSYEHLTPLALENKVQKGAFCNPKILQTSLFLHIVPLTVTVNNTVTLV